MNNDKLVFLALNLAKTVNAAVDDSLSSELADIVKLHSGGAAVAAVAGGWIPGAGAAFATTIAAGFIWTMYGRINSKLGIPLSKHIVKSVATAVAINLASFAIGSIALGAVISFVPGVGNIASSAISGGTCYALTLVSGVVYMKALTNIFKAGNDPSKMSADDLKKAVKEVAEKEDMKAVMKEAKQSYKAAKECGDIKYDKEC